MSLIQEQHAFLLDVCKLIEYATEKGYVVTGGELWRPMEMQEIYIKTGRSKTRNSKHLNRLAIDLNIFVYKDGKLKLCTRDEIEPLGDYWESLNPKNKWGGSWRGAVEIRKTNFIDAPHFERAA